MWSLINKKKANPQLSPSVVSFKNQQQFKDIKTTVGELRHLYRSAILHYQLFLRPQLQSGVL